MYTKEEVESAVKNSVNYSQCLVFMGKSVTGSSVSLLKNSISKWDIDIRHFTFKKGYSVSNKRKSADQVLVHNPRSTHRTHAIKLRRALIEIGRELKCQKCGLSSWLNDDITLEIDHLDGNWRNNLPDNLRFLCPNCHSQTPNFYHTKYQSFCKCGRPKLKQSNTCRKCSNRGTLTGIRKVDRPTREYLERLIWSMPTTHVAIKFGVSDKAVEKWCKSYGIDKPPRGYWTKIKSNAAVA